MASVDHLRHELAAQMDRARMAGRTDVLINSLELYRSFGGFLGSTLGLSSYCDAMHAEMKPGDILLAERSNSAGMTVRYLLPRLS